VSRRAQQPRAFEEPLLQYKHESMQG
jgi:hypothetical protein